MNKGTWLESRARRARWMPLLVPIVVVASVLVFVLRPSAPPAARAPVELIATAAEGLAMQLDAERWPPARCPLSAERVPPCALPPYVRVAYRTASIDAASTIAYYWDWDLSQAHVTSRASPFAWATDTARGLSRLTDSDLTDFAVRLTSFRDIVVALHGITWRRAPTGFALPSWDSGAP